MYSSAGSTPHRKPSRANSRPALRTLATRSKPGLALDTSFSRHQGRAPLQVFPYESKTQELSFISISDAKAQQKTKKSFKEQLENRLPLQLRSYVQRSTPNANLDARNDESRRPSLQRSDSDTLEIPGPARPPLHKRIKGLRPSPLDFSQDISPSDRAITIGIAVPTGALSEHTDTPQSARGRQLVSQQAKPIPTPTIVITPAREEFVFTESPEEIGQTHYQRPASSVYSRYIDCAPRVPREFETPPVPPLPLFVSREAPRESARTMFEEDTDHNRPRHNAVSVCTDFEEDEPSGLQPRSGMTLPRQSQLSTPRRSKGWWNLITSPFSAGLKSHTSFWRSPQSDRFDEDDQQRILDDASNMGSHAGVIFTNRTIDDDELRTALPPDTGSSRPAVPKRSDTAPAAIYAGCDSVNIYRVPSQGLAATYYDPSRHFPSLLIDKEELEAARGSLDGWSPSHSVAQPDEDNTQRGGLRPAAEAVAAEADLRAAIERSQDSDEGASESESVLEKDFEPPLEENHEEAVAATNPPAARDIFSTPSEEEMEASPPPSTNERSFTEVTQPSYFSPLTATPTVEDAHVATFLGPDSSNGDQTREVEVAPARSPGAPGVPLAKATMSSREVEAPSEDKSISEKPLRPKLHIRTDSESSRGLGISDGEKELFPPQRAFLQQQPRLGTDRFGQLTMSSEKGTDKPHVPWFRRFFWLLVSTAVFLMTLLVVLLVIFIPQPHDDMAVQAEWLNLTGFPPLPTGVATVIKPTAVKQVSGCVSPESLWSCDVPGQDDDQPNFRFEIRFRNGTVAKNETQLAKRSGAAAYAGALVRRDAWSDLLYTASPAAPSKNDQIFLGEYTDNSTKPYNGEKTPFYITLLDPVKLTGKTSSLDKRDGWPYPYPNSTTTSNASTQAATKIPRPALRPNGEPAEAELYPYAEAQPLRLFNRGQDDEHYGFYTYFDRSLYIANVSSTSSTSASGVTDSISSNVVLANASAVCTWSQTRLYVQIWTQKADVASLGAIIPLSGLPAANSTANDMTAPGSFPYAVTVTLDRHGGKAKKKGVYCYGLNEEKHVVESESMWIDEDRAFGGTIVHPAEVPSSNSTLTKRGEDYGGIDGGSGGCACAWQNWQ